MKHAAICLLPWTVFLSLSLIFGPRKLNQCAIPLHLPTVYLSSSSVSCFTNASSVLASFYKPCSVIDRMDQCDILQNFYMVQISFDYYDDTMRINRVLGQYCKSILLTIPCECKLFLILFSDWDRKELTGCIPFTQAHVKLL